MATAAAPKPAADHVAERPPLDDVDRLRLVLLRLARTIRTRSVELLTPSQLTVLATVARHGHLTVGQIADIEHVKPPSVSKIVATLEQLGYLERTVDPVDRRCNPLRLTPDGNDYLDHVRAAGRTWLASRLDGIDATDVATISGALPALERLLGTPE